MTTVQVHFINGEIFEFTISNEHLPRLKSDICTGISRKSYLHLINPDFIINLEKVTYIEFNNLEELKND
jgi:hypothetical protein